MATSAAVEEIETSGGPSYPLAPEQLEEAVDEDGFEFEALCLHPCCYVSDDDSDAEPDNDEKKTPTCTPDNVACAWVLADTLWTDTDVLKVFFLNPVPKEWKYDGKEITPELIVGWAKDAWKLPDVRPEDREAKDPIPQFDITRRKDKADIRVKFSSKKTCWSMLGSRAKDVDDEKKPTMVLNLGFKKGKSSGKIIKGAEHDRRVKSLVIHEFGHALGLGHEHQRSDFWDAMEEHLDLERMKNDERVEKAIKKAGAATCGADWFDNKPGVLARAVRALFGVKEKKTSDVKHEATDGGGKDLQSKYDPTSIMHYGFDKDWIKDPKYRHVRDLNAIPDARLPAKEYLIGVINTNRELAEKPSATDIQTLASAYTPPK